MNYPPSQPGPYQAAPQTNTMALVSLIFGILGLIGVCAGVGSIVAIVCGNMALGEIRANPAAYTGDGLARAGIILGWVGVVLIVIGLCIALASFVLPFIALLIFGAGASISSSTLQLALNVV
jgi:hypothetical protein